MTESEKDILKLRIREYLFDDELLGFFNEKGIKIVAFDYVDVRDSVDMNSHFQASYHKEFEKYFDKVSNAFLGEEGNKSWLSFDGPELKEIKEPIESRINNKESDLAAWHEHLFGKVDKDKNLIGGIGKVDINPFIKIERSTSKHEFVASKNSWIKKIKNFYPECNYMIYSKSDVESTDFESACFLYLQDQNGLLVREKYFANYIFKALRTFQYGRIGTVILPKQLNLIKQKSIKSSLSAVMARNQSHNIGSHVLSRFSQVNDLAEVLKNYDDAQFVNYEGTISETNDWKVVYDSEMEELLKEVSKDERIESKWRDINGLTSANFDKVKHFLAHHELANKRMALFNNYIKERQELLAEITSTVPMLQTNRMFKKEVLKGFTDNRILLDRISGIDNFKFTFKVDFEQGDDIPVAIANDVLGQQALYIILENIIRNTAKHGTKLSTKLDRNENVIFTIRVRESTLDSSYYQITVFDNLIADRDSSETDQRSNEKIGKDNNVLTNLILHQNKKINQKILTDDNELRSEALGLIEMEACAAYLRKLPLEEIESKEFELSFTEEDRVELKKAIKNKEKALRILRAVNPLKNEGILALKKAETDTDKQNIKKDSEYRENVLGYRFYLPKPQELLIIDTTNKFYNELDDKLIQEAKRNGITVLAVKTDTFNEKTCPEWEEPLLGRTNRDCFDSSIIYPHEQMLVIGGLDLIKANLAYLPGRKLKKIEYTDPILKSLKNKDFDILKTDILKRIVEGKIREKKVILKNQNHEYYNALINTNDLDGNFTEKYFRFEDHAEAYRELDPNCYFQIITNKEKSFYSKNLKKYRGEILNPSAIYRMFDSFLNNVVVLDERIQEKAETRYATQKNDVRTDISYREIWQNVGCYIPSKEYDGIDLSSSNYKDIKDRIKDWLLSLEKGNLKTWCNQEMKVKEIEGMSHSKIDTLIIHIGVLEKILAVEEKNKELPENKKDLVNHLLGDKSSEVKVILTSGRAPKKENLVEDFSFLTLSVVSEYLISNRFKYSLNELCNLARPKI